MNDVPKAIEAVWKFESTVHEGYATVGTDAGHTGFALLAGWALRKTDVSRTTGIAPCIARQK